MQSIDDLYSDVVWIQPTDISDVTPFAIVVNDVFYAAIIVVIIVENVETFFVISGEPLITVHVGQEVQIEVGIDPSEELHMIIIQTDTIAEMLVADIQSCQRKKQVRYVRLEIQCRYSPNIIWLARILDVRRKFSWQNSFSGQPTRKRWLEPSDRRSSYV